MHSHRTGNVYFFSITLPISSALNFFSHALTHFLAKNIGHAWLLLSVGLKICNSNPFQAMRSIWNFGNILPYFLLLYWKSCLTPAFSYQSLRFQSLMPDFQVLWQFVIGFLFSVFHDAFLILSAPVVFSRSRYRYACWWWQPLQMIPALSGLALMTFIVYMCNKLTFFQTFCKQQLKYPRKAYFLSPSIRKMCLAIFLLWVIESSLT